MIVDDAHPSHNEVLDAAIYRAHKGQPGLSSLNNAYGWSS
eukprot:CAMPEP_0202867296 /NCGR_PEP_ID=MMETSP1391-20130828/9123_1 /ASSEMBLY_ACC=CAM_ASM_000867 /TAXON_ID=1034604 /ORGANISM="Chlamydomonas leiostraca, Strain SAG 11-49" /LENGTH=39 /DNA_ID= /DNA_START= /DNA_END= /DNA_ORIENTATION=